VHFTKRSKVWSEAANHNDSTCLEPEHIPQIHCCIIVGKWTALLAVSQVYREGLLIVCRIFLCVEQQPQQLSVPSAKEVSVEQIKSVELHLKQLHLIATDTLVVSGGNQLLTFGKRDKLAAFGMLSNKSARNLLI